MRKHLTLLLILLLNAVGIAAQREPTWQFNANAYSGEHVVYVGLVDENGKAIRPDFDSYLGAFIDGVCRGQVASITNEGIDYFPMRVKGDQADNGKAISFRLFVYGDEYELTGPNPLVYSNGTDATGTLSNLFKLTFVSPRYYKFTGGPINVKVGEEVDMLKYIQFEPENANKPINFKWNYGNNPGYFEVKDYKLKGLKPIREAWLTAMPETMKPLEPGYIRVNVIQPATSITLKDEYKNGITVEIGDTAVLNTALRTCYTVNPANSNEELEWTSSDPAALVSTMETNSQGIQEKKFTPVKPGVFTMTLKGEKASIQLKVTVHQKVTGINQTFGDFIYINVGESLKDILPLTYKVMPEDATDKSVTYTIDNRNSNTPVLEERNGEIVGVNPGEASIIVKSKDNPYLNNPVHLVVYVNKVVSSLTFKKNELSFIKPQNDGDKADYFDEVKANIVFSPNWPQWNRDKQTNFSIVSDNLDVLDLQYYFYDQIEQALPSQLGTANVTVNYSAPHTIIQDGVLKNTMNSLNGSFKVNVVEGLSRFNIENVVTGLGKPVEVKIVPEPSTAKIDPSLIKVTVGWNPQFEYEKPGESWKIATIASASEDNLTWTLNPLALGHGIINVSYGNNENMGMGEFTIGQSYIQKEGWKWSTFLNTLESGTMNEKFGENVQEIRSEGELMYNDPKYGYFGDLTMLFSEECYKVRIQDGKSVDFIVEIGSVSTSGGERNYHSKWNWMPYTSQLTLTPNEYFRIDGGTFVNGDRIVSKDEGFAEFTDGKWSGTLAAMRPGEGYMFYNASNETKLVSYNGDKNFEQRTPGAGAKAAFVKSKVWTYNSAPYADNMTIVADLGSKYATSNYTVGAFVGGECRGEGRMVDGKCFITVHADKDEVISFLVHDDMTDEVRTVNERLAFSEMAGSVQRPVRMTLGATTSIDEATIDRSGIAVVNGQISIQGLDVASVLVVNPAGAVVLRNQTNISHLPSGAYIVKVKTTDGKTITKKITK